MPRNFEARLRRIEEKVKRFEEEDRLFEEALRSPGFSEFLREGFRIIFEALGPEHTQEWIQAAEQGDWAKVEELKQIMIDRLREQQRRESEALARSFSWEMS
ncbi:hypothetical protein DRN74_05230 [Candidatus Micrarchaeota archaeon]|nr:MAG: hypothetical protein DRN74_05230 [Candidatus Micrarchaeota archaeon]